MLLGFKPQFAPKVESGEKRQTIRARGKRRPPKVGELLQLYTGLRTKAVRKLVWEDPECTSVEPISVSTRQRVVQMIRPLGDKMVWLQLDDEEVESLAKADGFENADAFFDFFAKEHSYGLTGYLIKW